MDNSDLKAAALMFMSIALGVFLDGPRGAAIAAFVGVSLWILARYRQLEEGNLTPTWLPTAREIHETAEARARRQKTEMDLAALIREQEIEGQIRNIERLETKTKQEKGFSVSLTSVLPAPGENPEILSEAWRRFGEKKLNRPVSTGRFGGRFH